MEFFRDVNGVATVMDALYISMDGLQVCLLCSLIESQLLF